MEIFQTILLILLLVFSHELRFMMQYHGGTNFGRFASSYVKTSYYDGAPLDEYGKLVTIFYLPNTSTLLQHILLYEICQQGIQWAGLWTTAPSLGSQCCSLGFMVIDLYQAMISIDWVFPIKYKPQMILAYIMYSLYPH